MAGRARTHTFRFISPALTDTLKVPNPTCDTRIQCHSQGQPLTNPIEGRYYDWPVGFRVGIGPRPLEIVRA